MLQNTWFVYYLMFYDQKTTHFPHRKFTWNDAYPQEVKEKITPWSTYNIQVWNIVDHNWGTSTLWIQFRTGKRIKTHSMNQNVPQLGIIYKYSSGSRIPESHFFQVCKCQLKEKHIYSFFNVYFFDPGVLMCCFQVQADMRKGLSSARGN